MASAAAGYQQSDNLWCSAASSSASPSGFTSCFYKVKISMIKFYSGFKQRLSGSVVEHVWGGRVGSARDTRMHQGRELNWYDPD